MQAVVAGRDSVVVLPTGGGKSLCFQAPALCQPGLAVVVSPLISLMKDQVDALCDCGVPAACVNSTLLPGEKRRVADDVRSRPRQTALPVARAVDDGPHARLSQARLGVVLRHRRGALHQRMGARFPPRISHAPAIERDVSQCRRSCLHGDGHAARAGRRRSRIGAPNGRRSWSVRSTGRTWSIACKRGTICGGRFAKSSNAIPRDAGHDLLHSPNRRGGAVRRAAGGRLPGPALSCGSGRRGSPGQPGCVHQRPCQDHRRHRRLRHGNRQVGRALRDSRGRAQVGRELSAESRDEPGATVWRPSAACSFPRATFAPGAGCRKISPNRRSTRPSPFWAPSMATATAWFAGTACWPGILDKSSSPKTAARATSAWRSSIWPRSRSCSARKSSPACTGWARALAAITRPRCSRAHANSGFWRTRTTSSARGASCRARTERAFATGSNSLSVRGSWRKTANTMSCGSRPTVDICCAGNGRHACCGPPPSGRGKHRVPHKIRGRGSIAACSRRCGNIAATRRPSGQAPFILFSDATLRDLARHRPATLDELRHIRGIGDKKLADYGVDLLHLLKGKAQKNAGVDH